MADRRGPFAAMAPRSRHRLVARSLAGVVGLGAVMQAVARPMRAGGHDIVAFEVAGDAEAVDDIVEDWGPDGVRAAQVQTWMDMGFLVLYGLSTSAGCATVATAARRRGHRRTARVGDLLGWATWIAAACDAVENAAMLAELSGRRGPLPTVARRCALVKFSLIGPAVGYALGGLGAMGVARVRTGAPAPPIPSWAVLGRALDPALVAVPTGGA